MVRSRAAGLLGRIGSWLGRPEHVVISYTDPRFHALIPRESLRVVFEVGARHGDESRALAEMLPAAEIHAFECNPATMETCRQKLGRLSNVRFHGHALGSREETRVFYPFIVDDNPGSSSFLRRVDAARTQDREGVPVAVRTARAVLEEAALTTVDLLCMDVQGFELEVLRGFGDRLRDVRFVIMEEPALHPSRRYLPEGVHSKYLGAPDPTAIRAFMQSNGYRELVRLPENRIEDNVLYGRA